ncbi:MAG: trypsin-like peptidase domain-containing protein [Planctomycetota bacterium]
MNITRSSALGAIWKLGIGFIVLVSVSWSGHTLHAQLPQDVRDVFEGMMESLEPDLQKKFQQAIDNDTDKVEFTAEQFLRFRDNPANPFEGLDQLNVKKGGGNVALKFELPSMRDRRIAQLERQNRSLLDQVAEPAASSAASTVRIFSDQRQIALGIAISKNGMILTKASEVEVHDKVRCQLGDGTLHDATIFRTDEPNDLAILKVNSNRLTPIAWSNSKPRLGCFLLSPDSDGSVMAMGSYSVQPRSTVVGEQAFLGVQPITSTGGVMIRDVKPGAASYEAGLRDGDTIYLLGKTEITDVASLVKAIRAQRPGDRIKINYRRNGVDRTATATLGGNKISGDRAARFKMMNRLGAVPSRRDGNFPLVFQHDTPLFPEQCGGPIVNLNGEVIGINIARKGRAATYAIPADHAQVIVNELLRETVAEATEAK